MITVRRGVCMPAGESRRSSRAGDGGCHGLSWRWPGEPGRADCRRRVAVAMVLLAGDGLAGRVRDLRQRHMVPGRSLVVGLGS